jgi:hypothetical protein
MLLNIYIYRSDLFNVVSHNFYVFVHNDKSDVFKIRRNNYLCDLQKILLVTFGRGIWTLCVCHQCGVMFIKQLHVQAF